MNTDWIERGRVIKEKRMKRGDSRGFDAMRLGVSVGELIDMEEGRREPIDVDEQITSAMLAAISG